MKKRFFRISVPFFGLKLFLQRPLSNFLLASRTCSKHLKDLLYLDICADKKIVTARQTNRIVSH
eukprot:UN22356